MRATCSGRGARRGATFLVGFALAALFATVSPAAQRRGSTAPCGFTTKGASWTYKGQKGTMYSVVAIAGASCSTAHKWVSRLTHERASFDMSPVPVGWHCSTAGGVTTGLAKTGQCTTPGGGIVEWLPKRRK
jgi:hypothetical protein